MINTIKDWEYQVQNYLELTNQQLLSNEDCKKLYYGFEVIDGEIIMNPDFLFIGINPGFGNQEKHFEIRLKSERISYLDYFDDYYRYDLARETISIFNKVGLKENEIINLLLNKCIKTNLFHIITRKDSDIKKCLNYSNETNYLEYWNKSIYYCMQLLKITKPKIVIFEGKQVYNAIIEECYEIKNSWNKELEYGYYFSETDNIHFIGYKRLFSNIISKENIAEKIKEIVAM